MSQYCRYCAFCTNGDTYYCSALEKVLSPSSVRKANSCAYYAYTEMGDVDSGKPYKPREKKEKNHYQMALEVKEE